LIAAARAAIHADTSADAAICLPSPPIFFACSSYAACFDASSYASQAADADIALSPLLIISFH
jgi:hypothetical protein